MIGKFKTPLFLTVFFVLGSACGFAFGTMCEPQENQISSKEIDTVSAPDNENQNEKKREITNDLWFLIQVRSKSESGKKAEADELLNTQINTILTKIRQDSTLSYKVMHNEIWRAYLNKINSIWKNSPPFKGEEYRSSENQSWYDEFKKNHEENLKFLDSASNK